VPELPEVETVVRDLRPFLIGRSLIAVRAGRERLRKPWVKSWGSLLSGRRVDEIRRRGKWIVIGLDGGLSLVVHLGMTGQLTAVPAESPVANHTHLVFDLDDGGQLRYRDIRRFGSAVLYRDPIEVQRFFESTRLGPEPFDLDSATWLGSLRRTKRCLKAVLLDQRAIAGVGNIYADESLFESRLHPSRTASDLTPAEAEQLRKAIVRVLTRAIEGRGSSIRNYVGGSGLKGAYQDEHNAYGRTGKPCRRCRTPIVQIRLAGRSTHYCPRCQPESGKPSRNVRGST
jgi:formamidopyrimidine-DNA glycosylase